MMQTQELVSSFQVRKKIILRRAGQEMFRLLREIEKETLARTRRSLLGELPADGYRLFLNPLILSEDGRDDYLCAEHYYMFGNFDKDPDRFPSLRQFALNFLRELGYGEGVDDEHLEQALNVPENADTLVGTGNGEDSTPEDRNRKDRLDIWTRMLQREGVLSHVVASYEAVPLLAEYAPRVNPQQIKNALIFREEAERVEKIIAESRLHSDRLFAAIGRVASCRGSERSRFAARLLHDLFCYHRDLRGLEALSAGFDSINLVSDDKVRELSTLNGMLYEFLPPEDQKPAEDRVVHHVILKADVRDSSRLTRSLMEKGMNAASYFSLNFYDPVNKLLAKYGATKVFLEGDAIIVALLEREGETMLSVGRTCVLAWEIVSLLREYNELLERSGLPPMEVGLGIAYQDSPPLYLMDGEHRIMISDAINRQRPSLFLQQARAQETRARCRSLSGVLGSDRRRRASQRHDSASAEAGAEEMRLNYNVGGICLSEAAFRKLQQEISLSPWAANRSESWVLTARGSTSEREFFVGTVPIANGVFRKIVIRKNRIAQVDVRDLSILRWTDRCYYEVCANPAVYAALPGKIRRGCPVERLMLEGVRLYSLRKNYVCLTVSGPSGPRKSVPIIGFSPEGSSRLTRSETPPHPERNLHHRFKRHGFPRSFRGQEFPPRQSFRRIGVQTFVRAVENANVAHLAIRMNDRVERDHAMHVGANQFQRIARVRFFGGHRRQQLAFFLSRRQVPQTGSPSCRSRNSDSACSASSHRGACRQKPGGPRR